MTKTDIDFDRLVALVSGAVAAGDDEDVSDLVEEEAKLVDALVRCEGGIEYALRKLKVLAYRLRADGHDDCPEGRRNLSLLESAASDLRLALS